MSLTLSKPAPCIFVYENALTDGEKFISMLEEQTNDEWSPLSWDYATTGSGNINEYRSSRVCSLMGITHPCPSSPISDLFNKSILKTIEKCLADYTLYHGIRALYNNDGWAVLKYEGQAQYRTHYDHHPDNARTLSIVAFPHSTVGVGGELTFPYFDASIKPQTGSVVIFPSNFPYTHTAHPVEDGVKYSLVTWLR